MLFITNRLLRQSIRTRPSRAFDFDLSNNAASNSVFFYEQLGLDVYEELGSRTFLHLFASLRTGRVFPDDETRRITILRA